MLITRNSSPYAENMRIECSQCGNIIPESKKGDKMVLEKFKNCPKKGCEKDYCKNCWIVPAIETQKFL